MRRKSHVRCEGGEKETVTGKAVGYPYLSLSVVDGFLVTEIVKNRDGLILAKILTYSIRKNVRFYEPLAVLQKDDTGKWFVASMRNEKTGQFTFGKEVGQNASKTY